MENKIINWGVISCAGIAETQFMPGLQKAGNARLYAVSSRGKNPKLERVAEKFHPVKAYKSYEELLDDPEIDAVYVPLPNGLHAQWAIKALKKKKHVLCEKPMGISEVQEKEMQATAEENGVLLMEAFAYRHNPLHKKVLELIREGAVGTVKFIDTRFSFVVGSEEDVRLSSALSGGATYDIGCYNLSLIRTIAGEDPIRIAAEGKIGEKSGVDEESCILLTFKNGMKAFSYCSIRAHHTEGYTVLGDQGILQVPGYNLPGTQKILLTQNGKTSEISVECPHNYMLEAEQFSRAVLGEEKPFITKEDTLNVARIIDEALRQIKNQ